MRSLPLFHRLAGTRVVVLGEGDAADAKRRLVERAGAIPVGETEAHHARLAFVAMEDGRQAEAAALRMRRMGLIVNVTDRPQLCDFTVPSVLDRDPVLLAIGTSGASAGLAKALRLRLETLLPQSLGALAEALGSARDKLRARWPDASDRRRMLDAALSEGGRIDPLREGAAADLDEWLESGGGADRASIIEINLSSDDPDDLTLRQARLLGSADAILFDPEIPAAILDRARADAVRHALPFGGADPEGMTIVLRRAGGNAPPA